jgi:hypothetical protein
VLLIGGPGHAGFVQGLLSVFTVACTAIVISAAGKMTLYVATYGFSYEKFYASYTVLFCLVLFIYLLYSLVTMHRQDVLKATCYLFLWMYGFGAVLPVEYLIFQSNLELAGKGSRIHLDDLRMLSADVLPIVEREIIAFAGAQGDHNWTTWHKWQVGYVRNKKFYELNLSNVIYRLGTTY